jgi:hypothetical protein
MKRNYNKSSKSIKAHVHKFDIQSPLSFSIFGKMNVYPSELSAGSRVGTKFKGEKGELEGITHQRKDKFPSIRPISIKCDK